MVTAIIWLSLPRHRAALVNVWARLRLPLQPLETLAEGLRQLSLTTPGALREWLSTLASDDQQIPLWAYIPPEVQERAMHELRVDAIVQDVIIRSSAPCQAVEAHEPSCGVCRCPLAGTATQAWPAGCGHVLHLDCHLDLFRHAPPGERIYCPTCRTDEAGDPRPTRCVHGNRDQCSLTHDGSRPCGQRCRHNGWSRAALPSTDTPCPVCHPSRPAPGASLPPPQAATRRPPEAIPPEPDLCGTCGDDDGHSGLRTCVICDDYIDPPEAGAIDGEPWPTDECEHWVHCGCLQGDFAPEAEPECPGCRREGITNRWLDAPPVIHVPFEELPPLPPQYEAQLAWRMRRGTRQPPGPDAGPHGTSAADEAADEPGDASAPARPPNTPTGRGIRLFLVRVVVG